MLNFGCHDKSKRAITNLMCILNNFYYNKCSKLSYKNQVIKSNISLFSKILTAFSVGLEDIVCF